MKKLMFSIVGILALAACKRAENTPDPGAAPPVRDVSTVVIEPIDLAIEDLLPGRIVPLRLAEVRPQVSGIVRARLFEEGDTVKEGQPLYRIDPSIFQAEVAGAQATTSRNRAALDFATREAERAQSLAASGAMASQPVYRAQNTRAIGHADLALSEARLRSNQLDLRYSTVTAPIAGRIGVSRVTEGALVSGVDASSLSTIQQVEQVYVDIKQPAARYEELRNAFATGDLLENESVPVQLLSMQGQPYETVGRLLFTDISVDTRTSELTLRVLVPNPDLRLLPGMFVRARIAFGRNPKALVVPQQAVRHDPSLGESVLVVGADDKIVARTVRVGRVVKGRQIVQEGLAPGDLGVVEGLDTLPPGTHVRAVPWTIPTATAP